MGKHRENTEDVHIWKRNKKIVDSQSHVPIFGFDFVICSFIDHKTARGEEKTGPCGRNNLPAYKTLCTINEDLKPDEVDDWN
jgi:hypothetical protein